MDTISRGVTRGVERGNHSVGTDHGSRRKWTGLAAAPALLLAVAVGALGTSFALLDRVPGPDDNTVVVILAGASLVSAAAGFRAPRSRRGGFIRIVLLTLSLLLSGAMVVLANLAATS